jgi:hypothetical protein
MSSTGDRRMSVRLEVVGSLWGTLEVDRPVAVIDIGPRGMRIASQEIAAVDSMRSVQIGVGEEATRVDARVRHLHYALAEDGRSYCVIGLEFVSPPVALSDAIGAIAARTG